MPSSARPRFLHTTDMPDISDDDAAKSRLLQDTDRIAVVGASNKRERDSNRIFRYLLAHHYDALPVNPTVDEIDGVQAVKDLEGAKDAWEDSIDIVDVFRNKDAAPGVAQAAIDAGAKAIWFQFDTDHPDAVQAALDAGLTVVADRCIYQEHRRLLGGA